MRERWIQLGVMLLTGISAAGLAAPTTQPASSQSATSQPAVTPHLPPPHVVPPAPHPVATERHEPVAPPPPPPSAPVVIVPTAATTTKVPTTQPAAPIVAPVVVAATQPGPIDDRAAYGIGYSAGRRIHDRLEEDGRTADSLQVLKGVIDGLGDRDPAFNRQEVQAAFAELQTYTLQRHAEKRYADNPAFRKQADENLQKSRALLDSNAEMAGVEVRPDGVQVQTLTPGAGRVVANAKTLTLKNLRVSLADGTLVKASEADQPEQLSTADALPSLMDALRGMKVGTKARIWLPPDKAYGLAGKPPVVGPNLGIEYEFELMNAE